MQITLFGGSGFIGRHLAAELVRRNHTLSIPVRNRERVKESLILLPGTDVYGYEPNAMAKLKRGLAGSDVVVNLVGILNENHRDKFERIHSEFVRMLIDGCIKNQVPRFVQISALGASPGAPSEYLRSKAKGEQMIKNNEAVAHVIVRPSVVFGSDDSFINRFAGMIKLFPLLPLPMAAAKFQPIAVQDLVKMIVTVIEDDSYNNRVLNAGGPEVLTLQEIVRQIGRAVGRSPRLLPMSPGLSEIFAAVAEKAPFVELITRDNCRSMKLPSVCPADGNDAEKIAAPLTTFSSGLQQIFSAAPVLYDSLRSTAGRS